MSPAITKVEFLDLAEEYLDQNIMSEEVMSQMSRFKIKREIREHLLSKFLPSLERRSTEHSANWSVTERIAMRRLQQA